MLVAAGLMVLSGCSEPAPARSEVATVASPAAGKPVPAGPSTTQAGPQRPQLRLDMSDEEQKRLYTAYDDCLVGHGVQVLVDRPDGRRIDDSGEPKSAYTACAIKLPLQPKELDPDTNPKFPEQWQDNVRCLRKHGLKVHVTEPGEWTYDDDFQHVPDQDKLEKDCLQEAFGANG
ncbi:hypothetical protein GCM10010172_85210 [Paractinoplanes ferrugineus]|uniref:Uncharacterized protein n=2 Tax=Paractinoplanes ferrugineus TaxID=113564 RepID=A0A919JDP0_9ACTN|nr:hypothetical protein Afe05nite_71010 [Actinoplanes ferrugineus]